MSKILKLPQRLQQNETPNPVKLWGSMLTHIVICWLKDPGNINHRQKLVEAAKTFRSIPGIVNVETGCALPSNRPQVDSSYDIAVVITFKDEEALNQYQTHPLHQKAIKDVLAPFVSKFVVYDFISL